MALSSVAMDGLNLLFPFPATDPMLAAVCGGPCWAWRRD